MFNPQNMLNMWINPGNAAKKHEKQQNCNQKKKENAEHADNQQRKKGKLGRVALSGMALNDMDQPFRVFESTVKFPGVAAVLPQGVLNQKSSKSSGRPFSSK